MWALVDSNNIVVNKIVYDKQSNYIPPKGLKLREIERWVEIGMDADISENDVPKPPVEDPEIAKKRELNSCMANLAIIACFYMEKEKNSDLTFEKYIENLKVIRDKLLTDY